MPKKEDIIKVLKEVYDPEIPVNIVDLGLIYGIEIQDGNVHIKMTLTAPGCPLAASIAEAVRQRVLEVEGVENVEVELVWDPPWNPSMISEEGKEILRSFGFNV